MKKRLYIAYFTGPVGNSIGLFYVGEGIIAGIDIGGIKYDGIIEEQANGSYEGAVEFTVPNGTQLVTGLAGEKDASMSLAIKFAKNFDDGETITRIDTPDGPINAKFELLRELP